MLRCVECSKETLVNAERNQDKCFKCTNCDTIFAPVNRIQESYVSLSSELKNLASEIDSAVEEISDVTFGETS